MGTYDDEAPRLSEIGRMIGSIDRKMDDFRQEVRTALADKVSKETYIVERDALKERITSLETIVASQRAVAEAATAKRSNNLTTTIYSAVGALVVGIISAFLMTRGG